MPNQSCPARQACIDCQCRPGGAMSNIGQHNKGGQLHSSTSGRKLETGMKQTTKFQSGGKAGCKMWTSKYDCQNNGCHWDFNDSFCH